MKTWGEIVAIAILLFAGTQTVLAAPIVPGSFSTTWITDDAQIDLGVCADTVYWEEIGNASNNGTSTDCSAGLHQTIFPSLGEYRIDYSGNFTIIDIDAEHKSSFRTVEQWGSSVWTTMNAAFFNVNNLVFNAPDTPDLSNVTNMSYMFNSADNFNSNINNWDVSNVTTMQGMFKNAIAFNQPLNNWNVSNVTDMGDMFETCDGGMFQNATAFNQPLNNWNVSNVIDMQSMFCNATTFNQPLDNWNVSNVTALTSMFQGAAAFNQPLNNWNVSNVTYMDGMFDGATAFNQPLNNWDMGRVSGMQSMFRGATSFNQPLNSWDVSNVWFFGNVFNGASAFNQPLTNWAFDDGDVFGDILADSGIDSKNYAATLEWWASLNLMPDTQYGRDDIGNIPATYCDTAQTARDTLVTNGWIFSDEGATTCVVEEETTGNSGTATRVGDRANNQLTTTNTSTSAVVTKEGFIQSVRNLIDYLTKNEEELKKLTPEESKKIIIGLRDIISFLLSLLPAYD